MKYGYTRVSTKEQNLDRQVIALKDYAPDLKDSCIYSDKQSGKNFERTAYQSMKSILKPGDEVIVKELDRLGRNKDDVKNEIKALGSLGVTVRILELPTTLIDFNGQEWVKEMVNNILLEVLGTIAEQERKKILRRQQEGLDAMKVVDGRRVSAKTGVAVGRPEKRIDYSLLQDETITDACARLGISRTQWYRKIKKQNNPPSSKSTDCSVSPTLTGSVDTEIVSCSFQKIKEE